MKNRISTTLIAACMASPLAMAAPYNDQAIELDAIQMDSITAGASGFVITAAVAAGNTFSISNTSGYASVVAAPGSPYSYGGVVVAAGGEAHTTTEPGGDKDTAVTVVVETGALPGLTYNTGFTVEGSIVQFSGAQTAIFAPVNAFPYYN